MAERDALARGPPGWQLTSQEMPVLLLLPHRRANGPSYGLLKNREKKLGRFRVQPKWGMRSGLCKLLQAPWLPLLIRGTEEEGGGKGPCYSHQHNVLEVVWLWISALDRRRAGTQGTSAGQILSVDQK